MGCKAHAELVQAEFVNSKLRLFKTGFAPLANTPRSAYLAQEADYSGYPAGGVTLAAWNDPILTAGSGYQIGSPLSQFMFDSGEGDVGNVIGGGWLEDAAGNIWIAFGFAGDIPMETDGQGIPLNLIMPFLTGG